MGVVVKLEHQLAGPHFGFQPQNDFGSEMTLQLFERRADVGVQVRRRRRLRRTLSLRAAGGKLFDLADRQRSPGSAMRVTHAQLLFRHRQQRAAVPCGELAFFDPFLNLLFQLKQPSRVRYGGAILSGSLGHGFLGQVKLVHQPLEGPGSFHGVQVFALDVFDQRHFQRELVGHLPDDGGDSV